MRTSAIFSCAAALLLSLACLTCSTDAQVGGGVPPAPMFATNTSGFLQNGAGGPNNLVLFVLPLPPEPDDEGNLPPDPEIVQLDFTIIGDLGTGMDTDSNGVEDTLGNFAGLEWSSGTPGSGTLVGCVLNDDDGDGEIYTIDPDTGDTQLIGKAPGGLVKSIDIEAPGSGYGPITYGVQGGSGQNMTISVGPGAGGSVATISISNCGSGYAINDVVTIAGGNLNATVRVIDILEQTGFADLAFNPADGRLYGVTNEVDTTSGNGQIEFLPNTLWVDTDNDLIPDQKIGGSLLGLPGQFATDPPFCFGAEILQTLVTGIAFDSNGFLYVYDNVEEIVTLGEPGCQLEFPDGFGELDTDLTNSGNEGRGGMTVINGDDLIIACGCANNETMVMSFYIPDFGAPEPPDPEPPLYRIAEFNQQFFQTDFFADVAIGDLVSAQTNFDDAPETFPDNVEIVNGIPGKTAILEAIAISDDFRYCVFPEVPAAAGDPPISLEFVYTIPNPSDLTALGVEFEMHSNVSNVGLFVRAFNFSTQQFQFISIFDTLPIGTDDIRTADLTFSGPLTDFVDPNSGTMRIQVDAVLLGPVQFYPWQLKFDTANAVFEF